MADRLRERPRPRLDPVARSFVGQERDRDLAHDVLVVEGPERSGIGHLADIGDGELPSFAHRNHVVKSLGLHDRDHAFLALGDDDLDRLEVGLPKRDAVEVDIDADSSAARHLGQGGGKPGGAEVLQALDEAGLDERKARFDQLLARERIADLDGRPLVLVLVRELFAGEHARAADPISPSRRAEEDDEVARPRGARPHDPFGRDEPDAHGVDERVLRVGAREERVPADGGHTHAVAVMADTGDRSPEGEIRLAEAEAVEQRDGARSHGDDVAQNAPYTGRGALERLDGRRMVVALDLEGRRLALAEVDDARVLARALKYVHALARQPFQEESRVLVAAVLRPEEGENGELEIIRRAAEQTPDAG